MVDDPDDLPRLRRGHVWLFSATFSLAVIGTALSAMVARFDAKVTIGTVVMLLGVVVAAELASHDLFGDGATSIETVPIIACGVLISPVAVAVCVLAMTLGMDLARRQVRPATLFNFSTVTLAGLVAVAVQHLVPDALGTSSGWVYLAAGALAGVAYFLVNAPLIALAAAIEYRRSFTSIYSERTGWLLPHFGAQGVIAAGLVLGAHALGTLGIALFTIPALAGSVATAQYVRRAGRMVAQLQSANSTLERLLADNAQLLHSLGEQHLATIRGLARAIDAKDAYTAGHTERVARYAVLLAEAVGVSRGELVYVEHGALLHDIGKIGVPDTVLSKSGPLNNAEWQAIRRHPEIACFILEGIDLPPMVLDVVRSHHENVDGSGYPDRLVASELSLAARVARVADAFDAMTSTRPYRDALTLQDARLELRRYAGSQFCPVVVAALEDLIDTGVLQTVDDSSALLVRTA